MIKSYTAATAEIDDIDAAVAEILAALAPKENLLTHSLGIISCFSEFEDTGVLAAICAALPFDCIGATTSLCAAAGQTSQVLLTITVLTSDDCRFETFCIPIQNDYEQSIAAALAPVMARPEKPSLFLSYFPLLNSISGDMIILSMDQVTGEIPLFGTTAVDHTLDYATAKTIYNGQGYREQAILGAIYGNIDFTFAVASMNEKKMRSQKAIITESTGNILIGVNNKTALEYLEEIGLTREDLATGLGILPFAVDYNDGRKPVARAIFTLTPEGHAVCGGAMPVNATLCIGHMDREDVLQTTGHILAPLMKKEGTLLAYSCIARLFTLGVSQMAEAEEVTAMTAAANYQFAYAGGEICPLPDPNGKLKNFYHNFTICTCRLA